jgi:beta-RFAP synthase
MQATGPEAERTARHLETMRQHLGLKGAYHARIEAAVPAHAGLGSGTQIALAVAAGMRRLHGIALDPPGDAVRLGRGTRSGVGIGLFEQGGLVVDGGRGAAAAPAPIISRIRFPDEWRVVVVIDPHRTGMHGPDEGAAFAALPPAPPEHAARLCRLVVMQALPALAEHDIVNFGAAIRELQLRVGDYFAPAQGGRRFASPDVARALDIVDREGGFGIGQSSWGPTGFAFARSQDEAARLIAAVRRDRGCGSLDIRICRGLNRGADIAIVAAIQVRA